MSLENEFFSYHVANPQVYRYVDQFTKQAISRGYRRFAIATVWERIRWEVAMVTRDENFKLPNNHRAYYARMWMKKNPQYPGFFRVAMLRSRTNAQVDRFGREIYATNQPPK